METYKAFFDVVKKWTRKDYQTPKIKSEVIIDMLISEYIEEIVSYSLYGELSDKIKLIAKEFPIACVGQKPIEKEGNKPDHKRQYASVDYFLYDSESKTLYLTELKTTDSSLDGKQLLNMLWTCKQKAHVLYNRFYDIVYNYYIYGDGKSKDENKQKYFHMLKEIIRNFGSNNNEKCSTFLEFKACAKSAFEELKFMREDKIDCKILYVSLNKYDFTEDKINNLLKSGEADFNKNNKKSGCKLIDVFVDYIDCAQTYIMKEEYGDNGAVINLNCLDEDFESVLKEFDLKKSKNLYKADKTKSWPRVQEILKYLSE